MDMALNHQNDLLFSDQSMGLPSLPPPVTASQDWLMSSQLMGINGGVNFSEDQQLYMTNPQQLLYPLTIPNNQAPPLALPSSSSTDLSMDFSRFLSFELQRQTTDLDAYLHLQNQRLSTVLWEETRQRCVLLEKYASNLVGLIQKKENELALAKQTSMEIEQCIVRTDAQVKSWKKLATEKEAVVADLSYKLKKVQKKIQMMNSGAPDADSTCGGGGGDTSQDKKSIMEVYGNCKLCQSQRSCVLLFPCKHLCCCKSCEAFVKLCPVCESLKKGSMEIFFA
ncbi:RING-type domain-containing protein [Heracleum sosnowskyi]|uniref:RING-type domain-containing protein n=1 Tax=Heracleum sosnowskyi TaxID=360622 RepID=A0AAD8H8D8_9APIA|nr:RING-type domain-containing protein [Heracleum sosnowskyi]